MKEVNDLPAPLEIGLARGGYRERGRRYGPEVAGHLGGDQGGKGVGINKGTRGGHLVCGFSGFSTVRQPQTAGVTCVSAD